MSIKTYSILVFLLCYALPTVKAQSIVGFWEIKSVTVGTQTMTPVAKWMKINDDATYQSGNGWTQNTIGTWQYDQKNNTFKTTNSNGIKDEYGEFTIAITDTTMTWKRKEEKMDVRVTLVRTANIPMATADKIQGLWSLSRVQKVNEDITASYDPENRQFVHIRPDRLYRLRQADNKVMRGYWHMNGHRPELTFINFDSAIPYQTSTISFKKEQLIMKQKGSKGLTFTYTRIYTFPK